MFFHVTKFFLVVFKMGFLKNDFKRTCFFLLLFETNNLKYYFYLAQKFNIVYLFVDQNN